MSWPMLPAALLDGPRGRRLCWELLDAAMDAGSDWALRDKLWTASQHGDLSAVAGDLAAFTEDAGQTVLPGQDDGTLLEALAMTAQLAMYWQEPEPDDIALEDPAVRAALVPVAAALEHDPRTLWWADPLDRTGQQCVQWPEANPARLTGLPDALARWRADEQEDERAAAERPADPAARWSGHWWSVPALAGLPQTARSLAGAGPVGLALVEDPGGWQEARCQLVRPDDDVRCYEIDGPDSWAGLVARYPFDVSKSRRHDWWRVTGWNGRWLMPDYAAVAADYDAVHLTVLGYLTTAGRALAAGEPAASARTMLAGWAPDATYWLSDVLQVTGPPADWETADGEVLWTQVS